MFYRAIVERMRVELQIVDANPFVALPEAVLAEVFRDAGRDKSPVPVRGSINGRPYQQTLVRFRGAWRLYVNMQMLDDSPRRIGEQIRYISTLKTGEAVDRNVDRTIGFLLGTHRFLGRDKP